MPVTDVEFINPHWVQNPPQGPFTFTIRAEVVNPAPFLTPDWGLTTVKVTVKKVTGAGEAALQNGSNRVMVRTPDFQFDSPAINTMPNEVAVNDVLKAYIDIVWKFSPFSENNIGGTSYTVQAP